MENSNTKCCKEFTFDDLNITKCFNCGIFMHKYCWKERLMICKNCKLINIEFYEQIIDDEKPLYNVETLKWIFVQRSELLRSDNFEDWKKYMKIEDGEIKNFDEYIFNYWIFDNIKNQQHLNGNKNIQYLFHFNPEYIFKHLKKKNVMKLLAHTLFNISAIYTGRNDKCNETIKNLDRIKILFYQFLKFVDRDIKIDFYILYRTFFEFDYKLNDEFIVKYKDIIDKYYLIGWLDNGNVALIPLWYIVLNNNMSHVSKYCDIRIEMMFDKNQTINFERMKKHYLTYRFQSITYIRQNEEFEDKYIL
jgi:hypothetical protein